MLTFAFMLCSYQIDHGNQEFNRYFFNFRPEVSFLVTAIVDIFRTNVTTGVLAGNRSFTKKRSTRIATIIMFIFKKTFQGYQDIASYDISTEDKYDSQKRIRIKLMFDQSMFIVLTFRSNSPCFIIRIKCSNSTRLYLYS